MDLRDWRIGRIAGIGGIDGSKTGFPEGATLSDPPAAVRARLVGKGREGEAKLA